MLPNRLPLRGWRVVWCAMALFFVLAGATTTLKAGETSDSTLHRQIQFLKTSLKSDQQGTNLWWYGWMAGYGGATILQGALFFSGRDRSTRQDMAVGAITTFAGTIGQLISVFQPVSLAEKASLLPEEPSGESLTKRSQLEKMLAERSLLETTARHWQAHVLCTGVNLASGLVTWLGFHRTVWDGAANFGLNCVLTEAQIWSQPIRAKRALKRYNMLFGQNAPPGLPDRDVHLNFGISSGGAGVRLIF